jgi:tripartite-type tricarboxylate transporter receptor subunit TctC
MANVFTETWGQQVVVDNRPGGGGNVGCEITARWRLTATHCADVTSQ